jgi:general secretion pathway protein C
MKLRLAFILAVMLLVARAGNAFVEDALLPLPVERAPTRAQAPRAQLAGLSAERMSRLTGLPLPLLRSKEPLPFAIGAPMVRSALRLKLLGTLLEARSQYSVASIQDCVTLKSQTFMIGDKVQNAEALEIERDRVVVLNADRREFLDSTCGAVTIPAIAALSEGAPGSLGLGSTIKEIGTNAYTVPRPELERILANLGTIAMDGRIVPAFKGGVAQGFKLFSIRPDSVYAKIGIQNGDVIRRINGYELNSPETALELYVKLRESSRIEIDFERAGAPVRKTYEVR